MSSCTLCSGGTDPVLDLLLPALRSLPLTETVELLDRLTTALSGYATGWDGHAKGKAGSPSLPQVVGWINVLLDAHFAALLMSQPSHLAGPGHLLQASPVSVTSLN